MEGREKRVSLPLGPTSMGVRTGALWLAGPGSHMAGWWAHDGAPEWPTAAVGSGPRALAWEATVSVAWWPWPHTQTPGRSLGPDSGGKKLSCLDGRHWTPAIPKGRCFEWEKGLGAQPGLAEGGWASSGFPEGDGLGGRGPPSSQTLWL